MQFPRATPSAVKMCQTYQCWADQLGDPIPKVRLLISYLTLLMWLISSRMCTEKRQRRMASRGIQDLTCETVNCPDNASKFVSTWDVMRRLPYSFWNKTLKLRSLGGFVILVCLGLGVRVFFPCERTWNVILWSFLGLLLCGTYCLCGIWLWSEIVTDSRCRMPQK